MIKKVSKNIDLVKEAAEFAVSVTYSQTPKEFSAIDVQDPVMRKKIASLGTSVQVVYESGSEIPDSNVTFKTLTLFGVTEIIYDFAARDRDFEYKNKSGRDYHFSKLGDRIYYRRRPVPMM